jgi:hypothetical protein
MPLSVDNVIQRSSGSFVGTSGNATLPGATTAGNTLILVVNCTASTGVPTGFTLIVQQTLTALKGGFYWKNTAGGETSWTITPGVSGVCNWVVYEIAGLDQLNPVDVASAPATGTGSTLATGVISPSSTYDGLILCFHGALDTTSPTPGTWSGHTGGLTQIMAQGGNDGTRSVGMSVSEAYSLSIATWNCTATKTVAAGQGALAYLVVLSAAGAKRAADVLCCAGFEWGTAAGLATTVGFNPIFDAITGTPAVVTTSPRSGAYCLELSAAAAIENVVWTQAGSLFSGSGGQQVVRASLYLPSTLPASDVVLISTEPATAGQFCIVRYKTATQKLSIQVGTGTEISSNTTVPADTWFSVEYRFDPRTTTLKADWRIQYADGGAWVDQTQATMAAGTVSGVQPACRLGWVANTTATVRYDDVVVSAVGGHYPMGDMKVLPIKVDPGSSALTLSGTSTNFNTFTANGTLAAWNATTAYGAIDELPPTLGASADGFAQVAVASADYIEIPMDTINAAAMNATIRGVRAYLCGWSPGGATAGLGLRFHDGVGETTLLAGSVGPTFNNTATPAWLARMVKTASRYDWTQAKLDALALRVGFSTDVTPNMGIHAIYAEVVMHMADLVRIGSAEDDAFTVDFEMDNDSSAVVAVVITTPPGTRGATFDYDILQVAQTPIYVPPNTTTTQPIGATDIGYFTGYTFSPDPYV